ncbi:hypothetical protein JCM8547_009099 [Rhodosporidiobolus lusitaniae]
MARPPPRSTALPSHAELVVGRPPLFPSNEVAIEDILRNLPFSVLHDYLLPFFPLDVLEIHEGYSALQQPGRPYWTLWLDGWHDAFPPLAWQPLERDNSSDRAALFGIREYLRLHNETEISFDEGVVERLRWEKEVSVYRIWERWTRLFGLHAVARFWLRHAHSKIPKWLSIYKAPPSSIVAEEPPPEVYYRL